MYIKALQLTIWLIEERHYIILGNDSTNVWMYTAMAVTSTSILLCWISIPKPIATKSWYNYETWYSLGIAKYIEELLNI